jgi:hypothetical protein
MITKTYIYGFNNFKLEYLKLSFIKNLSEDFFSFLKNGSNKLFFSSYIESSNYNLNPKISDVSNLNDLTELYAKDNKGKGKEVGTKSSENSSLLHEKKKLRKSPGSDSLSDKYKNSDSPSSFNQSSPKSNPSKQ